MEGSHNNQTQKSRKQQQAMDQEILANFEATVGEVPTPLKIMAKRPGTLTNFMTYHSEVFKKGPLTERERRLIAVGVGVAMRSAKCIYTHANAARQAGASEDDIVQAMLIASLILGASPLRAAYSGVYTKE